MDEAFDAVVVGSGFGGTILALSYANRFEKENAKNNTNKKVCILERGQWWLSHELNYTRKATERPPNMREFWRMVASLTLLGTLTTLPGS
jgi:choline dehydrogenase-like flavoprotein